MKTEGRKHDMIAVAVATVAEFIFWFSGGRWGETQKFSNIMIYIMGAGLFFAVYFATLLILQKIRLSQDKQSIRITVNICILAMGIVYFCKAFSYEGMSYPQYPLGYFRHLIPAAVYLLVLLVSVLMAYLVTSGTKNRKKGDERICLIILAVIVQTLFLYCPNPYADTLGGIWHIDAYTNSIINTLNYTPHEMYSASVYGHYGLFFIIPCKILQVIGLNQWHAVAVTIAVAGGVGFAAAYYTLHKLIQNDGVFVIAVLANTVVSTEIFYGQYFQMMPHRYLFQMLVMACFCLTYTQQHKKKRKIIQAVGWMCTALGILWNTEVGVVCAIAWTVGVAYMKAKENAGWTVSIVVKSILMVILSFALAYGIVNVYNLAVDGNLISLSTFIFPLGQISDVIDALSLTLPVSWGPHFIVIALLLGTVALLLRDYFTFRLNVAEIHAFIAAIMGYGVYTYYINRVVEGSNSSIVAFTFILILAVLYDGCLDSKDETLVIKTWKLPKHFGVALLALTVMTSMVLSSVTAYGKTLSIKIMSTYDETELRGTTSDMRASLPENTVAFGDGTAQLMAFMNRCSGLYFTDWPDISGMLGNEATGNPEALAYLRNMLNENSYEHILVAATQVEYVPKNYTQINRYAVGQYEFYLYQKEGKG